MFIGREKEIEILSSQFNTDAKSVILIYGKRRIGKSTLISKASESFQGTVINNMCIRSTYNGNLAILSRNICEALGLPEIQFKELADVFSFLGKQNQKILLILDEYQYLKETRKKNEIDSLMQGICDQMADNIRLVLCGSYISVMKELLLEENPLFGRFFAIIHLEEMNYYDSSLFYPNETILGKINKYAIFGGSPYVLNIIANEADIEKLIKLHLLPETGILRSYIENIILREIQKEFDVRIMEMLGNGRKKYSEMASILNDTNGLLSKQLKNLLTMETITKIFPINHPGDRKKTFYTINDNLVRFYFRYIFGYTGIIGRIGEDAFFEQYIRPSLNTYISHRFEDICRQYLQRQIRAGHIANAMDIGTYWYDNAAEKTNGEFDCVIKKPDGYDIYECKLYAEPMKLKECRQEEAQIRQIKGLQVKKIGFICSSGFDFDNNDYELISGKQIYQ